MVAFWRRRDRRDSNQSGGRVISERFVEGRLKAKFPGARGIGVAKRGNEIEVTIPHTGSGNFVQIRYVVSENGEVRYSGNDGTPGDVSQVEKANYLTLIQEAIR